MFISVGENVLDNELVRRIRFLTLNVQEYDTETGQGGCVSELIYIIRRLLVGQGSEIWPEQKRRSDKAEQGQKLYKCLRYCTR